VTGRAGPWWVVDTEEPNVAVDGPFEDESAAGLAAAARTHLFDPDECRSFTTSDDPALAGDDAPELPAPDGALTAEQVDTVFTILVEECGARPDMAGEFRHLWPECREFRFGGSLGFGGKVYAGSRFESPYVGQYPEDATVASRAAIERANTRIAEATFR
jgi:hypothetical protein